MADKPFAWVVVSNTHGLPVLSFRQGLKTSAALPLATQGLVSGLHSAGLSAGIRVKALTSLPLTKLSHANNEQVSPSCIQPIDAVVADNEAAALILRHALVWRKFAAAPERSADSASSDRSSEAESCLMALYTDAFKQHATGDSTGSVDPAIDEGQRVLEFLLALFCAWLGHRDWWALVSNPNARHIKTRLAGLSNAIEAALQHRPTMATSQPRVPRYIDLNSRAASTGAGHSNGEGHDGCEAQDAGDGRSARMNGQDGAAPAVTPALPVNALVQCSAVAAGATHAALLCGGSIVACTSSWGQLHGPDVPLLVHMACTLGRKEDREGKAGDTSADAAGNAVSLISCHLHLHGRVSSGARAVTSGQGTAPVDKPRPVQCHVASVPISLTSGFTDDHALDSVSIGVGTVPSDLRLVLLRPCRMRALPGQGGAATKAGEYGNQWNVGEATAAVAKAVQRVCAVGLGPRLIASLELARKHALALRSDRDTAAYGPHTGGSLARKADAKDEVEPEAAVTASTMPSQPARVALEVAGSDGSAQASGAGADAGSPAPSPAGGSQVAETMGGTGEETAGVGRDGLENGDQPWSTHATAPAAVASAPPVPPKQQQGRMDVGGAGQADSSTSDLNSSSSDHSATLHGAAEKLKAIVANSFRVESSKSGDDGHSAPLTNGHGRDEPDEQHLDQAAFIDVVEKQREILLSKKLAAARLIQEQIEARRMASLAAAAEALEAKKRAEASATAMARALEEAHRREEEQMRLARLQEEYTGIGTSSTGSSRQSPWMGMPHTPERWEARSGAPSNTPPSGHSDDTTSQEQVAVFRGGMPVMPMPSLAGIALPLPVPVPVSVDATQARQGLQSILAAAQSRLHAQEAALQQERQAAQDASQQQYRRIEQAVLASPSLGSGSEAGSSPTGSPLATPRLLEALARGAGQSYAFSSGGVGTISGPASPSSLGQADDIAFTIGQAKRAPVALLVPAPIPAVVKNYKPGAGLGLLMAAARSDIKAQRARAAGSSISSVSPGQSVEGSPPKALETAALATAGFAMPSPALSPGGTATGTLGPVSPSSMAVSSTATSPHGLGRPYGTRWAEGQALAQPRVQELTVPWA